MTILASRSYLHKLFTCNPRLFDPEWHRRDRLPDFLIVTWALKVKHRFFGETELVDIYVAYRDGSADAISIPPDWCMPIRGKFYSRCQALSSPQNIAPERNFTAWEPTDEELAVLA